MPTVFVARSKEMQAWAGDVGLTRNVYKLGVADGPAQDAVDAFNTARYAGRTDWELLGEQELAEADEAEAATRLAKKETAVDPVYYPQIKGAKGVFKIKLTNVENHFLVRDALEGKLQKAGKITPGQVATYMIRMAAPPPAPAA